MTSITYPVNFAMPIYETFKDHYKQILKQQDIFYWSKVNIWNINCARATAFIFDTRTGVFVKVSKILRQKMSRPEGDSNPNLRIHAECSNLLSYQGQTFAVPCFEHCSGAIDIRKYTACWHALMAKISCRWKNPRPSTSRENPFHIKCILYIS